MYKEKENPEKRRARIRRNYHDLKRKLFDAKKGRCAECGAHCTEKFLEIHHTAEDGKNHRRRKSRYRWLRWLLDHPKEYALLCRHPCHRRVTMRYVRSYGRGGQRRKL
jgi:hypothetical protein